MKIAINFDVTYSVTQIIETDLTADELMMGINKGTYSLPLSINDSNDVREHLSKVVGKIISENIELIEQCDYMDVTRQHCR